VSVPRGISCGLGATDCVAEFVKHTIVHLKAIAAPETSFVGWRGACSGGADCRIALDRQRLAEAVFRRVYPVTATVGDNGGGSVESVLWPACTGPSCSGRSPSDGIVRLRAVAAPDAIFSGWTGACTGAAADCVLATDAPSSAVASFALRTATPSDRAPLVGVTVAGPGRVVGGEIDCGQQCASNGAASPITLTADPARNGVFVGWGGDCSGNTPQCTLTLNAARSVTAVFRRIYPLTVHGGGDTPVSVAPLGLVCRRTCTTAVSSDRVVTLSIPGSSSPEDNVSADWRHVCTGSAVACAIAVDAPTEVNLAVGIAAPFTTQSYGLVVSLTANGVVRGPGGFRCARVSGPVACSTSLDATAPVRLIATPKNRFIRWAGSCTGTKPVCVFRMDNAKTVIAYLRAP
jgi:hypothetical protein